MAKLANRARMTTTTVGTGTLTLVAAVSPFQTFANAGINDGDEIAYVIEDGAAWEIGRGIYTASGPTLTRDLRSSSSGSLISLSGAAQVFIDATAEELVALSIVNHAQFGAT